MVEERQRVALCEGVTEVVEVRQSVVLCVTVAEVVTDFVEVVEGVISKLVAVAFELEVPPPFPQL